MSRPSALRHTSASDESTASTLGDSRGQMVAVSGLLMLLLFALLPMLLNASAATGASATDGSLDNLGATHHVTAVEQHARKTLESANDASLNASERTARVATRIDVWGDHRRSATLRRGYDADATYLSAANGTRIEQSNTRNFTDATADGDWTVTTEADGLREFRITARNESLVGSLGLSDSFHVRIADDNGNERIVYVTQHSGDVAVQVDDGDGPSDENECRVDESSVTIDVTAGTVGGRRCAPLAAPAPVSGPLTVEFRSAVDPTWGDTINGTYHLSVNRTEADLLDARGDSFTTDGDGPETEGILYSVTVGISYRDGAIAYDADREIAPGELREKAD